jgi:hypothetical protein
MKYSPLNLDWYYSYVDIPNLATITQELIDLKLSIKDKTQYNQYYSNVSAHAARAKCPALMKYLWGVGLSHKFFRLLYSENMIDGSPPHVDTYDPQYCMYSLNIPLLECDNSYTAWFNTNNDQLSQSVESPDMYATINDGDILTEICRVESNRPLLANTTILHRGVTRNPNRTLVGLRFRPELTHEDLQRLTVSK